MATEKMIYNNLILNQKIWNQLEVMVQNNKLPHALLFHGNDGIGKEAHALELAGLLNNMNDTAQLAKIKNFQHPNIHLIIPMPREKTINKKSSAIDCLTDKSLNHLIEMKKNKMSAPYALIQFEKRSSILINSIRDINKNIHLGAVSGSMVYIIFEAEKLCYPKVEAGNALLKILEEPPKNTFFILVTSHKDKILDTILSRCTEFYFKNNSDEKIKKYFNDYKSEYDLDLLSRLSNGSIKTIQTIINEEIDIAQLIKNSKKLIKNFMTNDNWIGDYQTIETLYKSDKQTFKIFIKILIFILHDLEKIKNKNFDCLILRNINKTKALDYNKCIATVEEAYQKLSQNLNPSIGLFAMCIEMKKDLYK